MIYQKLLLPLLFCTLAFPAMAKWTADPGISATTAEESPAPEDNGQIVDAVKKLQELGIISDPDYWLTNARKGKSCDGGMVSELFINTAKKFGDANEIDAAVNILKENKILENNDAVEYWKIKATTGKTCRGSFVGGVIVKIANTL